MRNFSAEADGVVFEFVTMNIKQLQLFQVYVEYEGQKKRFHMQIGSDGEFRITDPQSCPEEFHQTEKQLSSAIKIYGQP